MKNKIFLIIAVALVLVAGVAYYYSNRNKVATLEKMNVPTIVDSTNSSSTIVEIKNFAFIPNIITINKGDAVTWINHDTATHRVIMGDRVLPDMKSGESSSSKFEASGSVNYFCELHPAMKGLVIVR